MTEKKKLIEDWMVRISFAEANQARKGFQVTDSEMKTKLALDKIMVVRSEKKETQSTEVNAMDEQDQRDGHQDLRNGKLNVMVLDDEPIVGKRLKPALERAGFDVETFEDPKLALDRLREKEFDIVVTDLKMEEVDGIQILEYIMENCKNTRVILITGYATVEVAREALVKGAFDFIAKPFKPNDLRAVINKAALSMGHKGISL